MTGIKAELKERLAELYADGRIVEAQRLQQRTMFDLEMLDQVGFCKGIENYSATSRALRPARRRPVSSTTSRPTASCSSTRAT